MDELLAAPAVLDQGLDREDRQVELGGQRVEPLAAGAARAVEDLADDADGLQAGEREQVDRRLGVPGAAEDAALLRDQRGRGPAGRGPGLGGGVGRARIVSARSGRGDAALLAALVDHDGEMGPARCRCSGRP